MLPDTINIEIIETPEVPLIFNNGPVCLGDSGLFWYELDTLCNYQWFDEIFLKLGFRTDGALDLVAFGPVPQPTISGKGSLVHEYAYQTGAKLLFSNYQSGWRGFN